MKRKEQRETTDKDEREITEAIAQMAFDHWDALTQRTGNKLIVRFADGSIVEITTKKTRKAQRKEMA